MCVCVCVGVGGNEASSMFRTNFVGKFLLPLKRYLKKKNIRVTLAAPFYFLCGVSLACLVVVFVGCISYMESQISFLVGLSSP